MLSRAISHRRSTTRRNRILTAYTAESRPPTSKSAEFFRRLYYADAVKEAVTEDLIAAGYTETQAYVMVYSGGLSIFSAMDPDIQAICDSVASDESSIRTARAGCCYQLTYRDPDSEEEGGIVNISSESTNPIIRKTATKTSTSCTALRKRRMKRSRLIRLLRFPTVRKLSANPSP